MTSMNPVPLNFFTTELNCFDPSALVGAVQAGVLEHVQLQKGLFSAQITHTNTSHCRTDWGKYNLSLLAQGDMDAQNLTLGILLDGVGEWHLQGVKAKNGDIVVSRGMSELSVSLPPQAQWLCVQVPQELARVFQLDIVQNHLVLHLQNAVTPTMRHVLENLAPYLGNERFFIPSAAQSEWAHIQLVNMLFLELGERLNGRGAIALPHQGHVYRKIAEIVNRWVEENPSTPLQIEKLCLELGISIWQLERAFHKIYGLSPLRMLTLSKLAKIRNELMTSPHRVTNVATAHGFAHLGRFSQLYKTHFGEYPSKTYQNSKILRSRSAI